MVSPTSKASLMFSFKGAESGIGNILEESPPSEFALITTIIVTPGGSPLRIPTSTSLLLQLLPRHISVVVSSQTPNVATPLPMVSHSAPTSSLVSASTQVVHDNDPLEEFFLHSVTNFLRLLW